MECFPPPRSRRASWSFDAQLRQLNTRVHVAGSAQQQRQQKQQMQRSFGDRIAFLRD